MWDLAGGKGREHSMLHSKHHHVSLNPAGYQRAEGCADGEQGPPVSEKDYGNHTCVAMNKLGSTSASIILYGRCPGVFFSKV